MVKASSATSIALGVLGLLGWGLGSDVMRAVVPGLATMKPATAFSLAVAGLSLWPLDRIGGQAWRTLTAAAVLLVGVATVVEYRAGVQTGLAGLGFMSVEGDAAHPYPLRMSEITAWALVVAGSGLLAAPRPRFWRATLGSGWLLGAIAWTALVGYLYDVRGLYSVGPFTSIAVNTVIGLLALTVGLLWSVPDRGVAGLLGRDSIGGRTARILLPVTLLLPVILGWLRLEGARAGLYPTEFGTALFALASITVSFTLVWGYGRWLDRVEAQRFEMERQLLHSQKMEAVGRLAAGVAHDFNNILTAVLTTATLAREDLPEDHPVQDDLNTIYASGERASGLVRQLLTFSRGQIFHPTLVDVAKVVRTNEPILRKLVPESVDLRLRIGRPARRVLADASRIEQVLMNLVMNAADALPGRRGQVVVETGEVQLDEDRLARPDQAGAGSYVMLSVSDDGVGMDRETMSRIFEPFFTTKAPGKGTGLGLATTYGIVTQSGGHVSVDSVPGQGTSFRVYLPVATEGGQESQSRETDVLRPAVSATVLIVDGDPAVLRVMAELVQRAGHKPVKAADVEAAAEIIRGHGGGVDLLIFDADAYAPPLIGLLAELRVTRPKLGVICTCGYAGVPIQLAGLAESGVLVLEKPFGPSALAEVVERALGGGSSAPPRPNRLKA